MAGHDITAPFAHAPQKEREPAVGIGGRDGFFHRKLQSNRDCRDDYKPRVTLSPSSLGPCCRWCTQAVSRSRQTGEEVPILSRFCRCPLRPVGSAREIKHLHDQPKITSNRHPKPRKRILVCGGRDFTHCPLVCKTLDGLFPSTATERHTVIIHGDAPGADRLARSMGGRQSAEGQSVTPPTGQSTGVLRGRSVTSRCLKRASRTSRSHSPAGAAPQTWRGRRGKPEYRLVIAANTYP